METINLSDGRLVLKSDYIKAKTTVLKEFGYDSLTEKEVEEQLELILSKNKNIKLTKILKIR